MSAAVPDALSSAPEDGVAALVGVAHTQVVEVGGHDDVGVPEGRVRAASHSHNVGRAVGLLGPCGRHFDRAIAERRGLAGGADGGQVSASRGKEVGGGLGGDPYNGEGRLLSGRGGGELGDHVPGELRVQHQDEAGGAAHHRGLQRRRQALLPFGVELGDRQIEDDEAPVRLLGHGLGLASRPDIVRAGPCGRLHARHEEIVGFVRRDRRLLPGHLNDCGLAVQHHQFVVPAMDVGAVIAGGLQAELTEVVFDVYGHLLQLGARGVTPAGRVVGQGVDLMPHAVGGDRRGGIEDRRCGRGLVDHGRAARGKKRRKQKRCGPSGRSDRVVLHGLHGLGSPGSRRHGAT